MPQMRDETQSFEVRTLEDLDPIAEAVGLPVGPRTGPRKRTKEKEEWYVILAFLRVVIPSGILKVPFAIRHGVERDDEPDFVLTRLDSHEVVALVEVTRASDESDQKELVASERSGKRATMPGEFGGRFADGAGRPGLVWASDVVEAIKRKDGKVIFRDSPAARHLLVYPNSNASFWLFHEEDEGEAVDNLRAEVAKDSALPNLVNGCVVHVLGRYLVCVDALGSRLRLPTRSIHS